MSLIERAGPSYGAARAPREPRTEPSPRSGGLAARAAAALLALAVLGAALAPRAARARASPRAAAALLRARASHNGTSERARSPGGVSFPNGTAAVYKRTHACTNARADAHWLQRYVGLTVDVAASKTLEGDACMVRTSGTSAGETGRKSEPAGDADAGRGATTVEGIVGCTPRCPVGKLEKFQWQRQRPSGNAVRRKPFGRAL